MNPHQSGSPTFSVAVIGAAMGLFTGTCTAQQSEAEGSGIRISGFGTLGLAHADAPAGWGFLRSLEQPASARSTRADIDSRLGVQLNYVATAQVEGVAQLLATRRLPSAVTSDAVEWAFAAYRPTADLAFRAGRLNLDQFVMSDYRNVGFAYLYARPPVEYYATIPSNLDGADVTRTWDVGDARWRAKGFAGRSKSVGMPLTKVLGLALTRESDGLVLRAGWSRANIARNSDGITALREGLDQVLALPISSISAEATALQSALDLAATPLTYATLGMTYERGEWHTAAELTRMSFRNGTIMAGYAGIGRHVGAFTWFGMVSRASDATPALATPAWGAQLAPAIGPAAAQQVQVLGATAAFVANLSSRQTTLSVGGRWDIHPRMALKAQWDHVKVDANGALLWANPTGDAGRANITSVVLDYVF
ncbi:hypothetical protein [uncultured Sphaerotilus sp.]|uniref:hypothetical protein n=1 Tax=uncultured Sphaerotilus sp. TaxID=474984 RepID=UPI0030CA1535